MKKLFALFLLSLIVAGCVTVKFDEQAANDILMYTLDANPNGKPGAATLAQKTALLIQKGKQVTINIVGTAGQENSFKSSQHTMYVIYDYEVRLDGSNEAMNLVVFVDDKELESLGANWAQASPTTYVVNDLGLDYLKQRFETKIWPPEYLPPAPRSITNEPPRQAPQPPQTPRPRLPQPPKLS